MRSIEWNEKGQRILSPLQRDAFERGGEPRKLEGRLYTDAEGNVWFRAGDHTKLVGTGGEPTLADRRPASESAASGALSEPRGKRTSKPRKRAKRK